MYSIAWLEGFYPNTPSDRETQYTAAMEGMQQFYNERENWHGTPEGGLPDPDLICYPSELCSNENISAPNSTSPRDDALVLDAPDEANDLLHQIESFTGPPVCTTIAARTWEPFICTNPGRTTFQPTLNAGDTRAAPKFVDMKGTSIDFGFPLSKIVRGWAGIGGENGGIRRGRSRRGRGESGG
ncbi:LOW QUALITY PROTEIN: hypothetical protein CVT26_012157 [Gymnopilus dilepis]|uniref:Uncharacterized protein n=1 Tax=Gymnopilus dilepis TaxID=231916 RepID=A0A409W5N2_9AGAR|nr:LOW QUALITY PROTEIN: hypothetical protein CVT26_012157 [Gymnopilus dilepis]